MIHNTQSAQISQNQDGRNIYVTMKTMRPKDTYIYFLISKRRSSIVKNQTQSEVDGKI